MKTYLIQSPAYRMNGLNGRYYSIAICEDDGDFIEIFGDHCYDEKTIRDRTNIKDIVGIPYSDSDRFISVKEVGLDVENFKLFVDRYKSHGKALNEWLRLRDELTDNDYFTFMNGDKKRKIAPRKAEYEAWAKEHPEPVFSEDYYGFLSFVVNEG